MHILKPQASESCQKQNKVQICQSFMRFTGAGGNEKGVYPNRNTPFFELLVVFVKLIVLLLALLILSVGTLLIVVILLLLIVLLVVLLIVVCHG